MTKPIFTTLTRSRVTSKRTQFPTTLWRSTALASAVMALVACGGGGDSDKNPNPIDTTSSPYIVYKDNVNKHIVLDSTGKQFAVTSKDLKLVYLGTKSSLKGIELTKEGSISSGGKKIASIAIVSGSDGKSYARLLCSGPAPYYGGMSISFSDGWSYTCASDTGQVSERQTGGDTIDDDSSSGGGGSGGDGSVGNTQGPSNVATGQDADQCVRMVNHPSGGLGVTNTCSVRIKISYCNLRPGSGNSTLFQCKAFATSSSPTGYTYQQGGDSVPAGATHQLQGTAGVSNQKSWVKACVDPDLGFISRFNTTTLTANSQGYGYCNKWN